VISDVPPKLFEILHRALAKERALRYQSGGDMLADLEECIYQADSRSNTRSFAQYIKTLFEEEFAAEELTLWAKAQIFSAGANTDPEQSTATDQYGKTVVLPGIPNTAKQKGGLWRLALVVGLVILAMIVDLNFIKMPFSDSYSNVSAYPTDDPVPEISVEDEKIAAAKAAIEDEKYALALNMLWP
jgi:hypothetical protein